MCVVLVRVCVTGNCVLNGVISACVVCCVGDTGVWSMVVSHVCAFMCVFGCGIRARV